MFHLRITANCNISYIYLIICSFVKVYIIICGSFYCTLKKKKKWEVRYPPKSEPLIQYCFKLYTHILPNISNAFPQILA